MQELLKNAWTGWQAYTEAGKYAALLVVVLLFFWFRKEECREKLLLVYTTVMMVCCIFPVSAALLMKYQTLFYDYAWIWSYVPLTMVIAYGVVVFLGGQWKKYKKASRWGITLMVLVLIALCGRLGQPAFGGEREAQERKQTEAIIAAVAETAGEQKICLWAPREIIESVRGLRADIRLIYGRNIWDAALGAYFYEPYGETEESLYLWMCNAEETGNWEYTTQDGSVLDGVACVKSAVAAGVNRILLPGTMEIEGLRVLSDALETEARQMDGYYLFVL